MLLIKLLIIILLAFIVFSLITAFYFLVKDPAKADSKRVLRTLMLRIALSILVLLLIGISAKFGLIEPHGLHLRAPAGYQSP